MKDFGLKRNGRPRKCPPRPQEGNPAWRASRQTTKIKPGATNRVTCSHIRKNGTKCLEPAVRGHSKCHRHGGRWAIPKNRREENRKAKAHRYALWSLDANQRKDEDRKNIKENNNLPTGFGM